MFYVSTDHLCLSFANCVLLPQPGRTSERDNYLNGIFRLPGFLIYFGYGMWHSEERKRLQARPKGTGAGTSAATSTTMQSKVQTANQQNHSGKKEGTGDQERCVGQEKTSKF